MKRSLAVALLLLSPQVYGDEKLASELFQRGAAAYSQGNYRDAAEAFEAAFEQSARGATMYNAAVAWQEAGDPVRAAEAFARALGTGDLVDPQLTEARRRLSVVEKSLGRVRLEAPRGLVSLGRVHDATPPVTVYVVPGTHTATLRLDDETVTRSVTIGAGERRTLRIAPPPGQSAPAPTTAPAAHDSSESSAQTSWGFVALGAGAAAAGVALVLGAEGIAARDEFDESNHTDSGARSRAISLRTWANLAWGLAIAGAGTGAFLLIDAQGDDPPRAALTFSGRF